MTVRWKTGKEPTLADIEAAITNSVDHFFATSDVKKIAEAVRRLYRSRESGLS